MENVPIQIQDEELILRGKKLAQKRYLIIWSVISIFIITAFILCLTGSIIYALDDTVKGSEAVSFILDLVLLMTGATVFGIAEIVVSILIIIFYKRTDYLKLAKNKLK